MEKRTRQISLYLSDYEWEALTYLSKCAMISRSALVRLWIAEQVKEQKKNG